MISRDIMRDTGRINSLQRISRGKKFRVLGILASIQMLVQISLKMVASTHRLLVVNSPLKIFT
jgi:hypothetical protein